MKLKVASIQMGCILNDIDANLLSAEKRVAEAASAGATLVLLPELMPGGYTWSRKIWDAAEPRQGKTLNWLRSVSKQYGIYLGTTYLEACGEDFFNTFVLTNPDGEESGRVRKTCMPAYEAFFCRGGSGPSVIKTAIGNIGVGICYDSWFAFLPRLAQRRWILTKGLSSPRCHSINRKNVMLSSPGMVAGHGKAPGSAILC